jgi:dihydroflavonol-4-reductase
MVGSELTRRLVAAGTDVRILRRENSDLALLGSDSESVEHALGDVRDPDSVYEAMKGVTEVYHAAAFLGFGGRRVREALLAVNVEGTGNVVNAALAQGIRRLVHISSMAAFGRTRGGSIPIDESSAWVDSPDNSWYARSKHLAEVEIHRGIAEGLDAVMVNPSLIFGMARPGENTRIVVEKVRDRRLPAVPSGGTNVVDVRDVATGALLAMDRGITGGRYFLGSENLAWREIIETLAEAFGVPAPKRSVPYLPAMTFALFAEAASALAGRPATISRETVRNASHFYQYSNRKAAEELGINFRPFRDTAQRLAAELGPPQEA